MIIQQKSRINLIGDSGEVSRVDVASLPGHDGVVLRRQRDLVLERQTDRDHWHIPVHLSKPE